MSNWSNLSSIDKQAFYSILDEYFESRPHLFNPSINNNNNNNVSKPLIPNFLSNSNTKDSNSSNHQNSNNLPSIQTIGLVSNFLTSQQQQQQQQPPTSNNSNQNSNINRIQSISQQFNQKSNQPNNSTPSGLNSSKKFFGGLVSQSEKDALQAKPRGILADAASSSSNLNNNNQHHSNKQQSFLPPPSRNQAPSINKQSKVTPTPLNEDDELVEAIYDYNGTSPEDLSFKTSDHQSYRTHFRRLVEWSDR